MNLYVIRHAIAVEPGTTGYELEDHRQPLTGKGREKMFGIARGLKTLEVHLDVIISSPYTSALDTARILQSTLKMEKEQIVVSENLTPNSIPDQLIGELNEKFSNINSLALIGHEPNLSALISLLLAGNPSISITMKKGGVCYLTAENLLHERRATLEWLLMPKHLVKLGDHK